jgi:histidinol-phosphate aminotransferase
MRKRDVRSLMRRAVTEIEEWPPGRPVEETMAELGLAEIAQMATNENPHGPSPLAVAAMEKAIRRANFYPHGPCAALRRKLAGRLGVEEDMVVLGNGGDNCIHMVAGAFLNEGEEAVLADPTFPVYAVFVKAMGGRVVSVPLRDHVHDLQGMGKRIGRRTKLVFVCNPNNPTGTIVSKSELDEFVAGLPAHVILLLDEAYNEFVSAPEYPDGLSYVKGGHNVIVLRTFSKLYGLAGLRIGYTIADPKLSGALARVREPYTVSAVSEAAAGAAMDDTGFVSMVLRNNEASKALLYEAFRRLGLAYVPTHTNFVLVDTDRDAAEVAQELLSKGYLVRPGALWRLPTWLRVTFGTEAQNRGFITALESVLAGMTRRP